MNPYKSHINGAWATCALNFVDTTFKGSTDFSGLDMKIYGHRFFAITTGSPSPKCDCLIIHSND
jgi:hypothetical protein